MSYLLKKLCSKQEVDDVIRLTEDLVLVLRFGRDSDLTCMQLDEIVSCYFQYTYNILARAHSLTRSVSFF